MKVQCTSLREWLTQCLAYKNEHPKCKFTNEDNPLRRTLGMRSGKTTFVIDLISVMGSKAGLGWPKERVAMLNTLNGRQRLARALTTGDLVL